MGLKEVLEKAREKIRGGATVLETGIEGKPTEEVMLVVCPAVGRRVHPSVCERCGYFIEQKELSRGRGQPGKLVVICGAPRTLPAERIIMGVRDA